MYIFRSDNWLEIPITLSLFKGTADEIVLVDSGATENFIDQETIKKPKLGTKKLETPVGLQNIDGTFNKSGQIMHYLDLLIFCKAKRSSKHFYITDLRSDWMILGYLWLHTFNPDIDWPSCKLIGPAVKIETLFHECYPTLYKALKKKWGIMPTQEKADQVDLVVRQTEVMEPEPLSEEDLIVQEAIEAVITKELDAEANLANSETFMEAREAITKQQSPKLHLDESAKRNLVTTALLCLIMPY